MVHPVPLPSLVVIDRSNREIEHNRAQNLMLFIRGKAISGIIIINGISQFPNPPIKIGIITKKIITKAWAVTVEL